MISAKRNSAIDSARGIALLLVIFGHCLRPEMCQRLPWCNFAYSYVYSFHVSLLFLLSGMSYALHRQKNLALGTAGFVKKKATAILLPWFSYAVLIYLLFLAANAVGPIGTLLQQSGYGAVPVWDYLLALLKNENPYSFHLWYLQALFLFVAATYFIEKYLPRCATAVKKVLIACMPLFYRFFCEGWVWTFKGFFQKYWVFLLGTLLLPEKIEKHKTGFLAAGLAAAGVLALSMSSKISLLYENQIVGTLTFYASNLAMVFTCLGIFAACCFIKKSGTVFTKIGQNSMVYYLYHQPFCCAFLGTFLYSKLHFPVTAAIAACFAASLAVPFAISRVAAFKPLNRLFKMLGLPC